MKITSMKQLSMEVTKREGKKRSISKAQIDEILGIVSDLIVESGRSFIVDFPTGKIMGLDGAALVLAKNGERRKKKK